jgi:hypothetical protein
MDRELGAMGTAARSARCVKRASLAQRSAGRGTKRGGERGGLAQRSAGWDARRAPRRTGR